MKVCYNDYGSVSDILSSVIHSMNQYINPGDSLCSGGPDGTGRTFLSLRDATLDLSLGYKHAAHFQKFLLYLYHSRYHGVDT